MIDLYAMGNTPALKAISSTPAVTANNPMTNVVILDVPCGFMFFVFTDFVTKL
jgi:hypothetical protein